ncbi:MAG: DUF6328 family protein [Solirubrobacteraceae bacterium]
MEQWSASYRGELRPGETELERVDRNLGEMLQEIRVAQAGVQILFAFLLALPFSTRWGQIDELQRNLYYAALLLSALSAAFLIAPTAYHRIVFRHHDKVQLVVTSNRLAIAGLVCLSCAMIVIVVFVTDVLFKAPMPVVVAAGGVLLFGTLWFAMPLHRRWKQNRRIPRRTDAGGDGEE